MDVRSIGKVDDAHSLAEILLLLRKSIMKDIHVSTLAFYSSTIEAYTPEKGYGIISARPFPLMENQDSYTISCYYLEEREFTFNQVLIVLYTDLIFAENLKTDKSVSQKAKNQDVHTQMSGILVSAPDINVYEDPDNSNNIVIDFNGQQFKVKKAD